MYLRRLQKKLPVVFLWIFLHNVLHRVFVCLFVADTALANVKLGELSAWVGRRNMSVGGITGGISRGKYFHKCICINMLAIILYENLAFWRWQHKYLQPKKVGIAPFVQVTVASMIFFYALNYGKMSKFLEFMYGDQKIWLFLNIIFRAPPQPQAPLVNDCLWLQSGNHKMYSQNNSLRIIHKKPTILCYCIFLLMFRHYIYDRIQINSYKSEEKSRWNLKGSEAKYEKKKVLKIGCIS